MKGSVIERTQPFGDMPRHEIRNPQWFGNVTGNVSSEKSFFNRLMYGALSNRLPNLKKLSKFDGVCYESTKTTGRTQCETIWGRAPTEFAVRDIAEDVTPHLER